ncbi:cell division protein SepF [Corynebacterium uterequi]|uniref:Cell division protein SepF n=1 Tax=Corynebacterium uterequi TaxID=1072256 RepID=A0A0G3HJY4_9CORY|nr:cell division protein SepF [Corynebacterium uterequi]AKK11452.1 hypothetical protein CUTER_07315 [Corynebacterium uterequi]
MSILKGAKEFFGLAPLDDERDDMYYDDEPAYPASNYRPSYQPERTYAPAPAPAPAPVRPIRREAAIVSVEPRTYQDAPEIGRPFADGDIVTFDLTHVDNASSKRLIDFAAGLCFALKGRMLKVGRNADTDRRVFAIIPAECDATEEELCRAVGI